MKTIRFEFREHGSVKYHTAHIPETLSEATGQQFTALLALSQGRIAEEQFFLNFFCIPEKMLPLLDLWQLYVLTDQLRDIWRVDKIDHFPIPEILIPWNKEKRTKSLRLTAPAAQLKGMTFQQFMTVDQFYQWYVYTGKAQYVLSMVAALYLEEGKTFAELDIQHVTARLENYPDRWVLEGLAFNWGMIRTWLSGAYPHLFPAAAPDSSGEARNRTGQKPRPGSWLNIFDTLVGDDLTRIETYKELPCMDVIRILDKRIKQQKA
ncbi:MAG: hypothetical protein IJ754_07970 [Bacteroidaceae bacterium]|nr:hypothetical protein [Bacteroidaceae bacterium]